MKKIFFEKKKEIRVAEITVPPDKSISHRSILLNMLAPSGKCKIKNFLNSEDTYATLEYAKSHGIILERDRFDNSLILTNKKFVDAVDEIDCKNSGTTARLGIALSSALGKRACFIGDSSLMNRPMSRITDFLKDMGAVIYDNDGKLPVFVAKNKLIRKDLFSSLGSAQQKTAWIMANINSEGADQATFSFNKPSRDHTERMLRYMGADIEVKKGKTCDSIVLGSDNYIACTDFDIPGDFSSAIYFIIFALVMEEKEFIIKDVNINITRSYSLNILKRMGADIKVENIRKNDAEEIADIIVKSSDLKSIIFDEIDKTPFVIDEIPALAIAAAFATGKSEFKNLGELRVKESDRLIKICEMLDFLGKKYEVTETSLCIYGDEKKEVVDFINTGKDHRIIMCALLCSIFTRRELKIDNISGINVSFPDFFKKLKELGYEFQYCN